MFQIDDLTDKPSVPSQVIGELSHQMKAKAGATFVTVNKQLKEQNQQCFGLVRSDNRSQRSQMWILFLKQLITVGFSR